MIRLIPIVAWLWVYGSGVVFAEQGNDPSTHPDFYTTVYELQHHGERNAIKSTVEEIDDRSLIAISFDETKMKKPENGKYRVKIRVEAFQTKDGDRDRIAPIRNYVSRETDDGSDATISNFSYHDKPYDPDKSKHVPNTIIDPKRLLEKDVDQIEILIINLKTKERLVFFLQLRELGFRAQITDTFMFFQRRGDGLEDGVDPVNFSPAAGTTFGTIWLPRDNNVFKKPIRVLRPGIGVNASILNWNDLKFDDSGRVTDGSRGSKLNVGLGVQFSLFNNILMFTYGANLQAERNRRYFGIGISFIQLTGAISEAGR